MKKPIQISAILILVLMLIAIRVFVQPYLYDPLIDYFKSDYLSKSIPQINFKLFFLNLFYRYSLNSAISLAIIYLVFKNIKTLMFSLKIYIVAFLVLCMILLFLLKYNLNVDYQLIFYVRRFLIHPVFLLILLPAFYYQQLKTRKVLFKK
jgi:exosortase F-associated protein